MKVLAVVALLFCGAFAQEGPQCEAPNGGGLGQVLKEFTAMIPMEQVLEVLLTAMTSDPETQAVMEYLSSPEFHEIVIVVQKQPSFMSLVDACCFELNLDLKFYFNFMSGIFGFPEVRSAAVGTPRSGFRNLLLQIFDMMPVEQMQALFEQKLASDYYVQLAFQKINSDEFGSIIETLQANAAYGDMKNRLRTYGVDVDLILDSVSKIFRPS